ncbi:hypothetical protein CCACVL1_04912, partial [Corchorus capsularis]
IKHHYISIFDDNDYCGWGVTDE